MSRRSSYFRYLLIPIVLVTFYCIFYVNETEEDALLSEKDTTGLRAKQSSNADTKVTPSPTSSPTPVPPPPAIEVKSHHELEGELQDAAGDHVYTHDTAQILYRTMHYRFPTHKFAQLKDQEPLIVTGVLSASRELRQAIRQTWAYHHNTSVFFLVGGTSDNDWDNAIAEEARYERDLFWVNVTEGFHQVLWKSQAFLAAVQKHIPTAKFILKTDDDSYVNLQFLQDKLRPVTSNNINNDDDETDDDVFENLHVEGQYIGSCIHDRPIEYPANPHAGSVIVPGRTYYNQRQEQLSRDNSGTLFYPSYAAGGAYIVGQQLAKCMARIVATTPLLSTLEDVDAGILAQVCGHRCVDDKDFYNQPEPTLLQEEVKDFAVAHYLGHYHNGQSIADNMALLHFQACLAYASAGRHIDHIACAPGSRTMDPSTVFPNMNNNNNNVPVGDGDAIDDDVTDVNPRSAENDDDSL